MNPLQQKLLDILKNRRGNLEPLSLRDIGERLGIGRKAQSVAHHLSQLERKGLIRKISSASKRYAVLTKIPIPETVKINMYGFAQCGPNGPVGEDRVLDRIPLPTKTFGIYNPDDFFLLKARGESMEPVIKEGNLILVRKQEDADDGTVAAVVHDGMMKIKKVIKKGVGANRQVFLVSKNKNFEDEVITEAEDNVKICGIVKAVITVG